MGTTLISQSNDVFKSWLGLCFRQGFGCCFDLLIYKQGELYKRMNEAMPQLNKKHGNLGNPIFELDFCICPTASPAGRFQLNSGSKFITKGNCGAETYHCWRKLGNETVRIHRQVVKISFYYAVGGKRNLHKNNPSRARNNWIINNS